MIAYFDTSAVIPLLVQESSSSVCDRLWDDASHVVSSRIMYAEARAALAMAQRMGRLTARQLGSAVDVLDDLGTEVDHVEITEAVVRQAGELAQSESLRGYDAIHLAAALTVAAADLVLVSGDADLAAAAARLGLAVARLG